MEYTVLVSYERFWLFISTTNSFEAHQSLIRHEQLLLHKFDIISIFWLVLFPLAWPWLLIDRFVRLHGLVVHILVFRLELVLNFHVIIHFVIIVFWQIHVGHWPLDCALTSGIRYSIVVAEIVEFFVGWLDSWLGRLLYF